MGMWVSRLAYPSYPQADHRTLQPESDHQTRINPMFWMWITGSWGLINRLQTHQFHKPSNPVATNANPFAAQLTHHLARPVKRMFKKHALARLRKHRFQGLSPFRHIVFLLQRREYTLSPCPILWDQLTLSARSQKIASKDGMIQSERQQDQALHKFSPLTVGHGWQRKSWRRRASSFQCTHKERLPKINRFRCEY